MGTDIHVYIEQKNTSGNWVYCGLYDLYFETYYDKESKSWRKDDTPTLKPVSVYSSRNYDLFSLLGDVWRGSYEPVVPLHGKPDDMSKEVYELTLDEDTKKPANYFFAYNYLTIEELDAVADMLYKLRKASKEDKEHWQVFRSFYYIVSNETYRSFSHNAGHSDTRIVYWFDN